MKKISFIISFLFCLFIWKAHSQVIKIDNGISLSWSNNSSISNIAYASAIGLDYFEKKHFMLNSKFGYLSKGESTPMIMPVENRFKVKIDYLNFSTTARFKQSIAKGNFFIGIGSSFDFKLNSRYKIEGKIKENEDRIGEFISEDFIFGFLMEAGYFYDITSWRFEITAGYNSNITRLLPESRNGLISHYLFVSLGIGYVFF